MPLSNDGSATMTISSIYSTRKWLKTLVYSNRYGSKGEGRLNISLHSQLTGSGLSAVSYVLLKDE